MLAGQADEVQQQEEQRHDVQVEVESSEDIFLWRDLVLLVFPPQDELSVKHQVLQRGGTDRRRILVKLPLGTVMTNTAVAAEETGLHGGQTQTHRGAQNSNLDKVPGQHWYLLKKKKNLKSASR